MVEEGGGVSSFDGGRGGPAVMEGGPAVMEGTVQL